MLRRSSPRFSRVLLFLALCVVLIGGIVATSEVSFAQGGLSADEARAQLDAATGGELVTSTKRETGNLSMVSAPNGAVLAADDTAARPEVRASAFLQRYGSVMGIRDAATELRAVKVVPDAFGMTHVRMDQYYNGLPVFGAQVVVHMNGQGITGVNGTFVPNVNVDTAPAVSREAALAGAGESVSTANPNVEVVPAASNLAIYRTGLLEGYVGQDHLAYNVVVEGEGVKEQVWIDAQTGKVLNRVSLIHEHDGAPNRRVYTPEFDPENPDANVVRSEGQPQINPLHPAPGPGESPPDDLYDYSGQTYYFFLNGFDFHSYDDQDAIMRTVYLVNEQCPNAYWNGETTNYCPGFDVDDVVAHEWGHAYTQYTHGLIYQYQSGALNESYSDIWGETVDLHNNIDDRPNNNAPRTDDPEEEDPLVLPSSDRWLVGEDLGMATQQVLLRDMWRPEAVRGPFGVVLAGDPGQVTSENYYCGTGDNGGVHTNSGVPNHAFAMLTDGQTYNGQTVSGLGFIKTTHIYFRAMTVYQVPSTNFAQHADALVQSCNDLIGQPLTDFLPLTESDWGEVSDQVITQADCNEVEQAMLAVEMRTPPNQCNYQPLLKKNEPMVCPANQSPNYVLNEGWEGSDTIPADWTLGRMRAAAPAGDSFEEMNYNWYVTDALPDDRPGNAIFAIDDRNAGTCQAGAGDISGHWWIDSPEVTVPQDETTVRFEHWVATELGFDGGNLKISINGGEFQLVPGEQISDTNSAGGAFRFNAPNQELDPGPSEVAGTNTNPLAGQSAWTGTDGGSTDGSWGTTIVDLSLLEDTEGNPLVVAGDTIQLRWDFGIDGCNGVTGWYVDRVEVYACETGSPTAISLENVGTTPTNRTVPLVLAGFALAVAGAVIARRRTTRR